MDTVQMVDAIIVQLNKIEVSGISNHMLIHDMYNLLQALHDKLQAEKGDANSGTDN